MRFSPFKYIVVISDTIYTYEESLEEAKKTVREGTGKFRIYKLVEGF